LYGDKHWFSDLMFRAFVANNNNIINKILCVLLQIVGSEYRSLAWKHESEEGMGHGPMW
jgi:hypothetical protein